MLRRGLENERILSNERTSLYAMHTKEECVEQSPFLLLLALLLRDLLDDGLLLSNGVCSSSLNFAVTLVTWLAPMLGEEHLDDPLLEP